MQRVFLAIVVAVGLVNSNAADKPIPSEQLAFFEKKIRPVLVQHCYKCHSADAEKLKGGLHLDTREGIRAGGDSGHAVVPGNLEESLLIDAIRWKDKDLQMPPKEKLPDSVIADFEQWIKMGAPDPRDGAAPKVSATTKINIEEGRNYWAFQPPQKSAPPKVKNNQWPRSDIDRFILSGLEAKGLKPAADADRATLIRRVYFDLTGLPPSPKDVDAFVNDKDPKAFEKVVDQLLQSPRFGERWGRHWLDIARYAESTGKERNVLFPEAWRYRDYVIASFNADKPYDQFIREQIAGDLLPASSATERAEHITATGFLAIGPKGLNERDRTQFKLDLIDEQIDVTSQAILGVTIACARCHDHKFDPIPSKDYYAMAGIFHSTDTHYGIDRSTRGVRQDSSFLKVAAPTAQTPAAAPAPVEVPAAKPDKKDKDTAALREKLSKLIAEREDFLQIVKQAKAKNNKAALAKVKEKGRPYYEELNQKITKLEAALGGKELVESTPTAPSGPTIQVMGVKDNRSPGDMPIYIRGEVDQPGERVPRGFVQVIGTAKPPQFQPGTSGRLELAQWLSGKDNPLTARVYMNRVWNTLFGRGIVPTVDNFGVMGERPSNQPLLDYLAHRFMDENWSIKKAVREVVLSRAYQMSSELNEKNYAADPENVLVWRMEKRRLDAESIRDAMLAVSDRIDLTPPTSSVLPSRGGTGYIGRGINASDIGMNIPKRSVYLPIIRDLVPDSLGLFDFAEPSLVVGDRDNTTVPAQALYLMNSPFVIEQAESLANRILARDLGQTEQIDLAYRYVLSRPATRAEQQRAEKYLADFRMALASSKVKPEDTLAASWASLCQALLASAEFRYLN